MIRLLARSWPVSLGAVVGNALLQALLVAPFVTPSLSVLFVALFVASFVVLVAAVAVVVARLRVAALGVAAGGAWPRWSDSAASAAVVAAVALASLASTWLSPAAVVIAIIVLAGVALDRGPAGFATFRRHPVRAILLTLLTLVVLVLVGPPGLGTLLAGFFITGWPGALLSWLGFGTAGALLLSAWTALAMRPLSGAQPESKRPDLTVAEPVEAARSTTGIRRPFRRIWLLGRDDVGIRPARVTKPFGANERSADPGPAALTPAAPAPPAPQAAHRDRPRSRP